MGQAQDNIYQTDRNEHMTESRDAAKATHVSTGQKITFQ